MQHTVSRADVLCAFKRGEGWVTSVLRGVPFILAPTTAKGGSSNRLYSVSAVIHNIKNTKKNVPDDSVRALIERSQSSVQ